MTPQADVGKTMNKYPVISLLIGGEWRTGKDSAPIEDPSDGGTIGYVPFANERDLEDALQAAVAGLRTWRNTSAESRAGIMMRAAALVRKRIRIIAAAITAEQGKPIAQSEAEIIRACDIIEWDAMEGRRTYGRLIPSPVDMQYLVKREPIGVIAAFSPWNFPISAPARKIGGALAAGCSVILKASEETPAGAFLLVQAFQDAGLPPGVLNLVFGNPGAIPNYLLRQSDVRLVTLTGSTAVGKKLAALAGENMKPAIMELGGHAPVIVCADADPYEAARISTTTKMRNAGQVCVAPTRFFVEAPIYDRFVEAFAGLARDVIIGNGFSATTQMGPLANSRRVEAIADLVEDAHGVGANVLTGGRPVSGRGHYFPLTVLSDVPARARAMKEEPFGPLALIAKVESLDEGIICANSLPYGLSAYAFTDSSSNVARLGNEIECGNLAINHMTASYAETPFGGVKESGYVAKGHGRA